MAPNSAGDSELVLDKVHGDDRRRAHEGRTLNRVQADASATENPNTLSWPDARSVDDAADAGRDRAADQGRHVQRNSLRHRNCRPLGHHRVGRVGRGTVVVHRRSVEPAKPGAAVRHDSRARLVEADHRSAGVTPPAVTAARRPRQHHMVSDHGPTSWSHRIDHAGALVAQHHRFGSAGVCAVEGAEATVANAAGGHSDPQLTLPGLLELERFHDHGLAHPAVYRHLDPHGLPRSLTTFGTGAPRRCPRRPNR